LYVSLHFFYFSVSLSKYVAGFKDELVEATYSFDPRFQFVNDAEHFEEPFKVFVGLWLVVFLSRLAGYGLTVFISFFELGGF
jgi:hypothetical protein